jgi:hypothetical protein
MVPVKEMPYLEKFDGILGYMNILEGFAPKLVREELGEAKVDELRSIWKKESETIPEDASHKDRYEIAYRNFVQNWVSAHNFMREHQGEVGAKKFMHAAIAGWRQRYSGDSLLLRIVGSVSTKKAFQILAKRLAYKLQVFSPFVVSELDGNRMILTASPCKILGTRGGVDFCSMACQNIIPVWLESQFNIKMNPTRLGESCTVTFEPF